MARSPRGLCPSELALGSRDFLLQETRDALRHRADDSMPGSDPEGRNHPGVASEKKRRAFAATCGPSSSGVVLRAAARRATVRLTQAGSFRLPRYGTGARYGESDSASKRSSGMSRSNSSSTHFLNVTIPLKETYQPTSNASCASAREPV